MPKIMAKGTVWLMGAQVAFLVSGYVIHFGLGRMLGPAEYGTFGVILSLLAIVRIFVQRGVPQAVSKYVSEGRSISSVKRHAIIIQSTVILLCFVICIAFAPYISWILGDEELTPYIRLMAFIIPISGLSEIYKGIINGRRSFDKQALIMVLYSIVRPASVFLFVLLGLMIVGVIGGLILAACTVLLLSYYYAKKEKDLDIATPVERGELFLLVIPLMILSVGISFIRSVDILFIKGLIQDKSSVGFYTSAWAISALPITIFSALSITMLPSVSSSMAKENLKLTRSYIKNSIRYTLMILLPIGLLIAANPGNLLAFFYTPAYSAGGGALRILFISMIFFTFYQMFNATIIGLRKPKIAMFIVVCLLPIDLILNYSLILMFELEGAAMATAIVTFIGMCATSMYIHKRIKETVDWYSTLKIIVASLIIFFAALFIILSGLLLILYYIALMIIYFGILWFMRELRKDDILLIMELTRFRK